MTKAELIEKLKDLPDDTVIRVFRYDPFYGDNIVTDFCVEMGCDGSNGCQAEVYLY